MEGQVLMLDCSDSMTRSCLFHILFRSYSPECPSQYAGKKIPTRRSVYEYCKCNWDTSLPRMSAPPRPMPADGEPEAQM